jgi:hypothetical protein
VAGGWNKESKGSCQKKKKLGFEEGQGRSREDDHTIHLRGLHAKGGRQQQSGTSRLGSTSDDARSFCRVCGCLLPSEAILSSTKTVEDAITIRATSIRGRRLVVEQS